MNIALGTTSVILNKSISLQLVKQLSAALTEFLQFCHLLSHFTVNQTSVSQTSTEEIMSHVQEVADSLVQGVLTCTSGNAVVGDSLQHQLGP